MNFTLHTTNNCNFNCTYCKQNHECSMMEFDVVEKLVAISMSKGKTTGFCFYGGEPLTNLPLIEKTVAYAKKINAETGHKFSFKLNTNGWLLNDELLSFLTDAGVKVGISHDGLMQDICRRTASGSDTFEKVTENAKILLKYQPDSSVLMTAAPEAVDLYADSVDFLLELGFRNILPTPAIGKNVNWTDDSLKRLKKQYIKTAKVYEKWFSGGTQFYFSAFDTKIESHIIGGKRAQHVCHLGKGQFSVSADGKFYPCTQFVGLEEYCIGDIDNGFDFSKQTSLMNVHISPDSCKECALRSRCTHTCGCMNMSETGFLNQVSPMQCEHERMLIEVSDKLGEQLYKKYPQLFYDKFYKDNKHIPAQI